MKFILFIFIFMNIESFAANNLLKNKDIIDIGHNQESREVEVPKEKIIKEPNIKPVGNKIVYAKRIQSQKYDCETDFLGIETCQKNQNICSSTIEYSRGNSIAHHVEKTYPLLCQHGMIKDGVKCFIDKDGNGIKDTFVVKTLKPRVRKAPSGLYYTSIVASSTPSGAHAACLAIYGSGWDIPADIDFTRSGGIPGRSCYEFFRQQNKTLCSHNYQLATQGTCDEYCKGFQYGWHDVRQYRCVTYSAANIYNYTVKCPIGYMAGSGGTCYKYARCPNGTVKKDAYTCIEKYDWYNYYCPNDVNFYKQSWRIIDKGSDCGNKSCSNSATPPANNCVRANYTCRIDPNMKCGKTQNKNGFCKDGFIWNSNRCERIEKFCGSSFYNATLDICQKITKYSKLCIEKSEVYDKVKNKCVSSVKACVNGVYSKKYNKCMMDFVVDCKKSGYVYNPVSDFCENKAKPLCKIPYNYDFSRKICVGKMSACSTGYTYNVKTKKCEKKLCEVLDTEDNGTKCVTQPVCDGKIIPSGACVPNILK